MNDEPVLRDRVRDVIEARALPQQVPYRMWGGPGAGADCAVCHAPVTRDEMEYEIEVSGTGNGAGFDRHHVHVHCLAAWMSRTKGGQ